MLKKLAALALVVLTASVAASVNATCPPDHGFDPYVICRSRCNYQTTWCVVSQAYAYTDSSCADSGSGSCAQLPETHCQCNRASLALF